jgi:hypothetical protein
MMAGDDPAIVLDKAHVLEHKDQHAEADEDDEDY